LIRKKHVCVPLQGSGTFAVEAMLGTMVPKNGHVLVPLNGAYCKRIQRIVSILGRKTTVIEYDERDPVKPADVDAALAKTRRSPTSRWCTARRAPACSILCRRFLKS
jgi:aspartate aminotransferase-like enzyme